jgi:hypothetical protein
MFIYLFYGAKVQCFIRMVASEITRKLSQITQLLLTLHTMLWGIAALIALPAIAVIIIWSYFSI